MTERSHDRKVRGTKIRSSREEKSKQRTREQKTTDRLRKQQDAATTDTPSLSLESGPAPDDQPFVTTDATAGLEARVRRWLDVGRPVHLVGPTGCGKTALAMHVARSRDRPVVWINGDAELTTTDLIGEYGETERVSERDQYIHNVLKSKDVVRDRWVDNPLTVAVREGATLVYNEFSRSKPAANNVLLSVFEEGVLELPGRRGSDRYVDVHPEFRAVLTSNSVEYAGVHEPQDALLDRLIGIHMDFYDLETEVEIVHAHVDALDRSRAETLVETVRALREALEITVGTRAAIMVAEGATTFDTLDADRLTELCVDVLASKVAQRSEVERLREDIAATIADQPLEDD